MLALGSAPSYAARMARVPSPRRRAPPPREVRTARLLLVLIPTLTIMMIVAVRLVIVSDPVRRAIAFKLAGMLANQSRSAVQLSDVSFGWDFSPCFHDLEIYRFEGAFKLKAATREACVERWSSALGSGFRAIRIRLDEPTIEVEGAPKQDGEQAFVDVQPDAHGIPSKARAALREFEVVFDELRLNWVDLPVPDRFAAGSFGPIDGTVRVQLRGPRSALSIAIRDPASGASLNGRATPADTGWDLSVGVEGDVVPIFGFLLDATELDIRRLPSRGRLGVRYDALHKQLTADVDLQQFDADISSTIVSSRRIQGFDASEKFRVDMDLTNRRLEIVDGVIEVNNIPVDFSVSLAGAVDSPPFSIKCESRTTPFIRMLRAVPGGREPLLASDIPPKVEFAFSFSLRGLLKEPSTWEPRLEYRFQGIGSKGEGGGLKALRSSFAYYPLTARGRSPTPRLIGPDTTSWIPYARIPYVLRRAVIVSEDANFPFHEGLDMEGMKEALQSAIETGEKARGGSTISQQLVKNLFLSRDRTALRKAQEALLTLHMERTLSKEEIFALYMNIIEWGPDVYGIREAAHYYFGKGPRRLSPREMAYLATIIPNPLAFHEQHYENNRVPWKQRGRTDILLDRLNRLGQLGDEAFATAKTARIVFAKPPNDRIQ